MSTAEMIADHQPFEYYLVLDFESTCQDPEQVIMLFNVNILKI